VPVVRHHAVDQEMWSLAARQHGIVARSQLRNLGMSREAIRARLADGRMYEIQPGVYCLGGAPRTRGQQILAACLTVGDLGLASHRTAGQLWRLDGIDAAPVEVVMPRQKRRMRRDFLIHESRDLRSVDASSVDGIPVTSPIRTLLDLGAVVHRYRLEQAVDDALRRKLITLDALRHRFLEVARKGRRGVGPLRPLLEERLGLPVPPGSGFEAATLRLIDRAGLPRPVCQHPVDIGGTIVYLDLAWPDLRIAIECDSLAHHFAAHRLRWDDRRQNALVLMGWLVLRVTWQDTNERPKQSTGVIQQAWSTRSRAPRSGDEYGG
jgi:hypothetical protein